MKYILLLLPFFCFCQIKNGIVDYKIVFVENKDLEQDEVLGGYYKNAKAQAQYVAYQLLFDTKKMLFYKQDVLSTHNTSFTEAFSDAVGLFYYENGDAEILNDVDDRHLGRYIIKLNGKFNWKLHNEQKKIDQYMCLKATCEISNAEKTRLITAWYCPQIPITFGPKGYNGLPGLILELNDGEVVFGASKISTNSLDKNIEKPKGAKILTEKEYDDLIEKMHSENK